MTPELVFIATSDFAARTKGRAVPAAEFDERTTVGWVPANLGIGPSGRIAEGLPFGSAGDLRLRPDPSSRTRVAGFGTRPPVDLVFADIVETDGTPWPGCPRTFLREAIEQLRDGFGIEARVAFEHEFVEPDAPAGHPFSFQSLRAAEPLGGELVRALREAGFGPETWLAEYGAGQYELTISPADPLRAADRAIALRDIVRDAYEAHGRRASFSPVVEPGGAGNGVHVHIGLRDLAGSQLAYDPARPGRLSRQAARFAAGILRHAPGTTAFFAPLTISSLRLKPHNWSAARIVLGERNREALLRICPTNELDGRDPAPQLHFEFRGADAGANPWLLLGLLLRAGMQGLGGSEEAPVTSGELELDGAHAGLPALPGSLAEALEALRADRVVSGWFHPDVLRTFLAVKRAEIAELGGLPEVEQCARYAAVY
ncbi:MAG: glutamine synthetase family protein [Pseudoclavibacter sp.]|nr:glutamine synthetase family protein [Pseudoclavibacter sp.]